MRRGKKPTRKQKIRLGQAGLAPENWLVVKQKANGELIILNKYHDTIRVIQMCIRDRSRREKSFFIRNSFLADAGRGGGRPAKDGLSKGVCPDIIKGTTYRLSIHCTGLQDVYKRQALDLALRSYAAQLACARLLDILQPPEEEHRAKGKR